MEVIHPIAAQHAPLDTDAHLQVKVRAKFERGIHLFQVCIKNDECKTTALTQAPDTVYGPGAMAMAEALRLLVTDGHQKKALEECKHVARDDESLNGFWSA